MASRSRRSRPPAGSAQVSHRQATEARAELAAGGLSHQEQRRLRSVIRSWEDAERRRRRLRKHLMITLTGAVLAMAIVALSFGFVPAINAALGDGVTGIFVVGHQVCSSKTGCQWVGTFRAGNGAATGGLAYGGSLPSGAGPGSSIPARYPGGTDLVYALHGSHTWVFDLLVMVAVGAAVGAALWISPLGDGGKNPAGARASA